MEGKNDTERAIINARLWRNNAPNNRMERLNRRINKPKKRRWINGGMRHRKVMGAAG